MATKFELGRVVITSNAAGVLSGDAVRRALQRHAAGDWGNVNSEDAAENELSLREGFRLLSVYECGSTPFWIITEADRSATTVLLPADY